MHFIKDVMALHSVSNGFHDLLRLSDYRQGLALPAKPCARNVTFAQDWHPSFRMLLFIQMFMLLVSAI